MNKKVPEIFVNKIKKINNNKEVYYSFNDKEIENDHFPSKYEIKEKINKLFRSSDFVYKKNFHIKRKEIEGDYTIISKSFDYLLTINGEKIYIDDIIDIE